jgi:folate-binding protein YgfZ
MMPSEVNTLSPPAATPLAALLASPGTVLNLAVFRGALTPREFDAPGRETAALAAGAAVHDLGWMRRVAVHGEDRFRWLSGMVSNTVKDLAANGGAWNLVLNAQGRIQGDLWVWRNADHLELEVAADQIDKLRSHLNHFIIMDDVELAPLEDVTALGITGPRAGETLKRAGLPELSEPLTQAQASWHGNELTLRRSYGVLAEHYELWTPAPAAGALWEALGECGAVRVGAGALEAFRVAEGIPVYGIDIAERDLPQETSQARALCFNKGCYLGQEIVERIRSRGNVHRHLRHLELEGPAPAAGTELKQQGDQGKAAGQITSAAELPLGSGTRVFALGMVRSEADASGEAFSYADGTVKGTARILAAAPALNIEAMGNREP